MSSTVVVGVDGSDAAADAVALSAQFAAALDARVLAVYSHEYGRLESILGEEEYARIIREVAGSTFSHVKEHLASETEREMQTVSASSPAAGLTEVAEEEAASLIVVGPSKQAGLGRVRPGSVGERLLSGAPTPVAVAPLGYAEAPTGLNTVATAFDGSPESDLALAWAKQIAERSSAELVVISVHTPIALGNISAGTIPHQSVNQALERELREEHEQALKTTGGAEGRFEVGDAAEVLTSASDDADLLVMGSRGYGPVRGTLLGGVSRRVIDQAACPVVVCPRGAADS